MTKLHQLYPKPADQNDPRSRDELESLMAHTQGVAPAMGNNTSLSVSDMHRSNNQQNALILEALLDIRDLLVQQVSLLDLIEHNTQSAAVVFESQIDKHHLADPPIAEFASIKTDDHMSAVSRSNAMMENGWRAMGSAVDPYGSITILLGRPTPREQRA